MSLLGTRVKRTEDPALLRGDGKYVGDIVPDGAVHAVFVRSMEPHGTITTIDTSDAVAMDGVVAVLTADDLGIEPKPPAMPFFNMAMLRSVLAADRVRYVGELVAVVLAETYEAGVDAAEAVFLDIEPLPAVIGVEAAERDDVLLFPEAGTNSVFAMPDNSSDDFFAECDVTVELTFDNPRVSGAPVEPRNAVAHWEEADGALRLTQWSCTQFPHTARDTLAGACGVEPTQVRVITPEVGGGFGAKSGSYPEDIVVAMAARHIDRPVRWTETRTECMLGLAHGRGMRFTATIGGNRDGNVLAYRLRMVQDGGGYPATGSILPMVGSWMGTGVYDIPGYEFSSNSVVTNTVPVGAYRGAGRPEATHAIERMIEMFSLEIGMDSNDVRRLNFIAPEQFPFSTPSGQVYDCGRYAVALDSVNEQLGVDAVRAEQAQRRADGSDQLIGVGWCAYVEIANPTNDGEFGSVEIQSDGSAIVLTGSSAHGQGHHTTFAQVASATLGIPFDKIEVRHGDTDEVARGVGTGGSKSLQIGGSAVREASEAVVEQAKQLAANLLEASVDDIVLDVDSGTFAVAGTPAVSVGWIEVAGAANENREQLIGEVDFAPPGATFPFGVHASVVEVDRETGAVTVLRHVACDDAGRLVNPMIVDGQVHGGIASGVGQALMEEFCYDESGNPITANLAEYGFVSSAELPSFERIELETPTDRNPLGAKGIGESGTLGSMPAVQNAVIDALSHLGVRHIDIPLTAEKVWSSLQ